MLTNAVATIITKVRQGRVDVYKPLKSVKVHWEDSRGYNILQSSRALNEVDNITVYMPIIDVEIEKFKVDDYIVRGEVTKKYTSDKELFEEHEDTFIITSVDKYDYGSPEMQHIRIGAK